MQNGVKILKAGGFTRIGVWRHSETTGFIRFDGASPIPHEPAVYAYVVNGIVRYVGKAHRGLHRRLRTYEITKSLRTAYRVRQEILSRLARGDDVDVFAIVPPPLKFNDVLPVD